MTLDEIAQALMGNTTSTETITTTKKELSLRQYNETKGGFQQAVGEGIGGGFEAMGEGYGHAYGSIGEGIGQNIIPLGLLAIGGLILAKRI